MSDAQVLIIGGGITGCLTACLLADAGVRVLLVEQDRVLMNGASRWNDGKIHLGYTFNGTASLATASLLVQGSGVFFPTLERVLGARLPDDAVGRPVLYLVDRQSMVDAETLWERARATDDLARRAMDALPGLDAYPGLRERRLERVAPSSAEVLSGQPDVVDAWSTPEIHVSARVVADRLVTALLARPIDVLHGRVMAVEPCAAGWAIRIGPGEPLRASVVLNCAWEGRPMLDRMVAGSDEPVSIRYKYALFGRGVRSLSALVPSTRILGRFGDVAAQPNGDAYLGWYPAGLAARSDDGSPPSLPPLDTEAMMRATLAGLRLPGSMLRDEGATWEVRGGHVVAHGQGDIDHMGSPLHRRDRPAVTELRPGYLTVDTGKYTLGPLMAHRASTLAARRLGIAVSS
jgi:glycine/D-amino acid oxidase-like deaminating enzyme